MRDRGLTAGSSAVEIGSGNGYFALPAARITHPAPVYAIDIDDALLDELETLADRANIDNVRPVHGDARQLGDLLPGPVDVGLIANTFHGIDDPTAFVAGAVDGLAEDGRFVVINWHPLPREQTTIGGEPRGPPTELRLDPEETRDLVESAADLTLEAEIDLPPYHYGLRFER